MGETLQKIIFVRLAISSLSPKIEEIYVFLKKFVSRGVDIMLQSIVLTVPTLNKDLSHPVPKYVRNLYLVVFCKHFVHKNPRPKKLKYILKYN